MTTDDYFKNIVFQRLKNIFQTSEGLEYNLTERPAQEAVMQKGGRTYPSTGGKTIQFNLITSIPGKVLTFVYMCHREKQRHRV